MDYLIATTDLKNNITETNNKVIKNYIIHPSSPNHLFLHANKETHQIKMVSFTDDFIREQINLNNQCNWVIFTNLVTSQIKGKEFTYFLYKGYHSMLENGLVYYQMIHKETLEPVGSLQFSNQEKNLFFRPEAPSFEESSCNAIEAKGSTTENKKIVFLIGNINEERLLYDIERLIVTTFYNSLKHVTLQFQFIVSIARYGETFSMNFDKKLTAVKEACISLLIEHPNINFSFEYAE